MKNNTLQILSALGVVSIAAGTATAGDDTYIAPVAPAPAAESKLSGSISADWNSHFISYGTDVWGGQSSLTREDTLFVSVGIDYAISDSLTFSTGFWLDVNDNDAGDTANSDDFGVQETDIWFGLSKSMGIATYSATFQNWQYAGESEEVLDLAVSLDTFLSPSLLWHKRLDGSGPQQLGSMLVLSGSYDMDLTDSLSLSIPVAVAYATEELNGSEDGYAYTSVGLQGSYALTEQASANFGLTYYMTDEDVTGNSVEDFLTANAGVSFSF